MFVADFFLGLGDVVGCGGGGAAIHAGLAGGGVVDGGDGEEVVLVEVAVDEGVGVEDLEGGDELFEGEGWGLPIGGEIGGGGEVTIFSRWAFFGEAE